MENSGNRARNSIASKKFERLKSWNGVGKLEPQKARTSELLRVNGRKDGDSGSHGRDLGGKDPLSVGGGSISWWKTAAECTWESFVRSMEFALLN